MKEIAEFRVSEKYAKQYLSPDTGKTISSLARMVRTPIGSELYNRLKQINNYIRENYDDFLFYGWAIDRQYTQKEINSANLFRLIIKRAFEPCGVECGTIYDDRNVCNYCGAGLQQVSDLTLDFKSIPHNVDIARTLSEEIVISDELAKIMVQNEISGYMTKEIHHRSHKWNGRRWFQLIPNSFVNIHFSTITGIDHFDPDIKNEYRCPLGHVIGLSILSELSIINSTWNKSDIAVTRELIGVNRGLLRASPLVLISQKLRKILVEYKVKGIKIEVAHLVN